VVTLTRAGECCGMNWAGCTSRSAVQAATARSPPAAATLSIMELSSGHAKGVILAYHGAPGNARVKMVRRCAGLRTGVAALGFDHPSCGGTTLDAWFAQSRCRARGPAHPGGRGAGASRLDRGSQSQSRLVASVPTPQPP